MHFMRTRPRAVKRFIFRLVTGQVLYDFDRLKGDDMWEGNKIRTLQLEQLYKEIKRNNNNNNSNKKCLFIKHCVVLELVHEIVSRVACLAFKVKVVSSCRKWFISSLQDEKKDKRQTNMVGIQQCKVVHLICYIEKKTETTTLWSLCV